jgi:PAS domain S-box-containing protein
MIIASGILLDRRLGVGASAIMVASCVGVGIAELAGVVETRLSHMLSTSDVIFLAILMMAVASLVYVMSRTLRDTIRRATLTDQSYREIFNATGEGLLIHDAETGEVVEANDTALSLFGYTETPRGQLTFESILAPAPPFDREAADERMRSVLAGDDAKSFEWCAQHRDGTPIWLEVTLRAATIQGHRRVIAVFRDISAQRAMQDQMRQTEKLRAVGQLARGVAHDFNNQLTVILANASLLQAGVETDSTLSEYARAIIDSSRRSADLTQQLLAFARKGQRQHEPIDLDELVADVKALLARSIDKRIEVVHERSSVPAIIEGDATFMQNALLNLGLNARDAMPEGGRLRLAVEGPAQGRAAVTICVEDTGCGMAPEVVEHVFEPFFTTKDEGNGMGLAAVYGTVATHGGSIAVDSELGCGTRFVITLPAAETSRSGAGTAVADDATQELGGLHVLLAEDETAVAGVAKRLLGKLGCEVTHCADGISALDHLTDSKRSFDLALIDHSMPGMTGAEVLHAVRERGLATPVIAMSGYTEASDAASGVRPDAFVAKPFDLAELSDAIDGLGLKRVPPVEADAEPLPPRGDAQT